MDHQTRHGSGRRLLGNLIAAGVLASWLVVGVVRAEEKVVFIFWGGKHGQVMKEVWAEPFEKETGIKVEIRYQESNAAEFAKLRAQKNNLQADLWGTAIPLTFVAEREGLLAPIPRNQLTNAKELPPNLVGDHYVTMWIDFFGIAYNKDKVPFKIEKWSDILDPRLKNKISVPPPSFFTGKFLALLSWINGGDENNIEPAFLFAQKLKPNIASFQVSSPDTIKLMTSGETDVALLIPPANYLAMREAGSQFIFVAPEPFVPAGNTVVTLLKGPNTANAVKLINFLMGRKAQEEFAKRLGVLPANINAAAPENLAKLSPGMAKMRFADERALQQNLPSWTARWNREIQTR